MKKPNKNAISIGARDFQAMYAHLRKSPMAARDCAYCLKTFTPKRTQDKGAKFCTKACREEFHDYGGLPMRILLRPLEIGLRRMVADELDRYLAEAHTRDRADLMDKLRDEIEKRWEKIERRILAKEKAVGAAVDAEEEPAS